MVLFYNHARSKRCLFFHSFFKIIIIIFLHFQSYIPGITVHVSQVSVYCLTNWCSRNKTSHLPSPLVAELQINQHIVRWQSVDPQRFLKKEELKLELWISCPHGWKIRFDINNEPSCLSSVTRVKAERHRSWWSSCSEESSLSCPSYSHILCEVI